MEQLDRELDLMLKEFAEQVEREYQALFHEIEESFSDNNESDVRAEHSVKLARLCGVKESKIMNSNDDLDKFLLS